MFCKNCGTEIQENTSFCPHCGTPTETSIQSNSFQGQGQSTQQVLLHTYVERVKTNAIIWMVIGGIQIFLGLFVQWVLLIVGIVNLIASIRNLNYSKEVIQNPRGIVAREKPLLGSIIVLIYNLLLGGIIGVIGSIYYLIGVRSFVLENETYFTNLENESLSSL